MSAILLAVVWVQLHQAAPALAPPRPVVVSVGLGFSHWYSSDFGSPVGLYTPGLNVAVRPKVPWLEVTGAYTLSVVPLTSAVGTGRVGFASAGLSLLKELRLNGQRVGISGGLQGGFVHTARGVGGQVGARLGAHYLIELRPSFALGPAFEARALVYGLPGSSAPFFHVDSTGLGFGHSDVQIDLSLAVAFF